MISSVAAWGLPAASTSTRRRTKIRHALPRHWQWKMTKAFSVTGPGASGHWTRFSNRSLPPAATTSAGVKCRTADLNCPCGICTEAIVSASWPELSTCQWMFHDPAATSGDNAICCNAIFGSEGDSTIAVYSISLALRNSIRENPCFDAIRQSNVDHRRTAVG